MLPICFGYVVDGDYVWLADAGYDCGFTQKATDGSRVSRQAREELLDRNRAVQHTVVGQVHSPPTTAAQQPNQLIATKYFITETV
jgi:hypothetical protein